MLCNMDPFYLQVSIPVVLDHILVPVELFHQDLYQTSTTLKPTDTNGFGLPLESSCWPPESTF